MDINESFVRWQERLLEQRASLNSLLLGIAVATLGYQINLALGKDAFSFHGLIEQHYYEFSTLLIALSIIFGLLMGYTRLTDYTLTTKLNRLKSKNDGGLKDIRKKAKCYGKLTKFFFAVQTFSLALGFLLLSAFYIVRYSHLY